MCRKVGASRIGLCFANAPPAAAPSAIVLRYRGVQLFRANAASLLIQHVHTAADAQNCCNGHWKTSNAFYDLMQLNGLIIAGWPSWYGDGSGSG